MRTIAVQATNDHIQRLANINPVKALAELIWNGLDADAQQVSVEFVQNAMSGLSEIRVVDDGHGLTYDDAEYYFGQLGGSWKKQRTHTAAKKRLLHGKNGEGRFRAFALGANIIWQTQFSHEGKIAAYKIIGNKARQTEFSIDDAVSDAEKSATGTTVTVVNVEKRANALLTDTALTDLTEYLALYLTLYPDVAVIFNEQPVNPAPFTKSITEIPLKPVVHDDGTEHQTSLAIIEWNHQVDRGLFLCDAHGFTFDKIKTGIRAEGFTFTAYLKSDLIRTANDSGWLLMWESDPKLVAMVDDAREALRDHFRMRAAEAATDVVTEWKRDHIYPYDGEADSIVQRIERQVFDVCALNVNSYLPDFSKTSAQTKKLSLKLIKHALETGPSALQRILTELLELPADKREELADLLGRTSLEAIINASRTVTDRLDFLKGLEAIVFDEPARSHLLERKQLHRIIARETWLFGEQYHLSVDDESLTAVLHKHLEFMGDDICIDHPVTRDDGSVGIVDLMLSRKIQIGTGKFEHLVVELKRPTVKIDASVLDQVDRYANAIANDERFKHTNTKWIFWAVSNDIESRTLAKDKGGGLIYDYDPRFTVWMKPWGSIIAECRARLEFFEKQLAYNASIDSGIAYLQRMHAEYVPSTSMPQEDILSVEGDEASDTVLA